MTPVLFFTHVSLQHAMAGTSGAFIYLSVILDSLNIHTQQYSVGFVYNQILSPVPNYTWAF